jgi:hypothetical protein
MLIVVYNECHLCRVSFKLSVVYAECHKQTLYACHYAERRGAITIRPLQFKVN